MAARRFAFAILACSALGAAGQPTKPSSSATAQATARIREPVILRAGKALKNERTQALQTKERRCAAIDASAYTECRLILTELE